MAHTSTEQPNQPSQKPNFRDDVKAIARIAEAFASREATQVEDILTLVKGLLQVFQNSCEQTSQSTEISDRSEFDIEDTALTRPALPLSQAVQDDTVFCLVCGRGFSMLKRHLRAEHGLSEDEYRALFSLGKDFPLVAPAYSARRAEHARKLGLGKHNRSASQRTSSSA